MFWSADVARGQKQLHLGPGDFVQHNRLLILSHLEGSTVPSVGGPGRLVGRTFSGWDL